MGMSPSPFSNWVPCTHSLCRIPFLCEGGSICAQSFDACSICLDPFAAALRFWTLSCLAEGDCGRCLRTVIVLCGPHPRPLAMLCSLSGLSMLAYCAACRIGILHGCRVRISFAWFRSRSVADTNSLSRMSALLTGSGAICAQTEVCHYRGDQLAGRQLLMRFRCSVSIAPVLSDMCSADLGDSAPPLVTLMAIPRPMRLAMLACCAGNETG